MKDHLLMVITVVLMIIGVTVFILAVESTGLFKKEEDITPREAYDLILDNKDNENFTIIDVRTPEEYMEGHLGNAILLNYHSEGFRDDLDQLDKNNTYLIYCRLARRSSEALVIMEDLGFQKVYNMLGGITQWMVEGLPVVK